MAHRRLPDTLHPLLLMAGLVTSGVAAAVDLAVQVMAQGEPVAGALVLLRSEPASPPPAPVDAVMDQIGSQFVPRLLVVPVGSKVAFPNSDITRHQVYSFSPAKRFDLPLYSGTPPEPVVFERPGVVTLGCNIHDWMVGYIAVVDTPHYLVTDDLGEARGVFPKGHYRLEVWHERRQAAALETDESLSLDGEPVQHVIEIQLAPPPPPRGDERMRALQEKFRSLKRD